MKKILPKKSLGQNFLSNQDTLKKIIEAAAIESTDDIIEIGPGHGVLTEALLEKTSHVTTIELDDRLIPELKKKFGGRLTLTIIHSNVLEFDPPENPYKLIANIPYYITSPILNHFLKEQPQIKRPKHIVFLVQYEVAQKICARPGDLSILALQVQTFGKPTLISKVPATHFIPAPQVDSAILKIELFDPPLIADKDLSTFFRLLHMGFLHKRKKLIKNLKGLPKMNIEKLQNAFKKVGLSENSRAEQLSIAEWQSLKKTLSTLSEK